MDGSRQMCQRETWREEEERVTRKERDPEKTEKKKQVIVANITSAIMKRGIIKQ